MIAIAIHGGAGPLRAADRDPERERAHLAALDATLTAGHAELLRGATALDVVTGVVAHMEDSGLYNAGRGAVTNRDGEHALDAALMEGATRAAGAVAGVRSVRNPIMLARAVLAHSPHVLLVGRGAEDFARAHGLALVSDDYFVAQVRSTSGSVADATDCDQQCEHGTVGAV